MGQHCQVLLHYCPGYSSSKGNAPCICRSPDCCLGVIASAVFVPLPACILNTSIERVTTCSPSPNLSRVPQAAASAPTPRRSKELISRCSIVPFLL